jgi:hypothetical protein
LLRVSAVDRVERDGKVLHLIAAAAVKVYCQTFPSMKQYRVTLIFKLNLVLTHQNCFKEPYIGQVITKSVTVTVFIDRSCIII